jgi:hypothetical protein
MRSWIAKAKACGGFLGNEFVGRFNDGAKWIAQLEGVCPVAMVNAPELAGRLRSHVRTHAHSSPQAAVAKM